MKSKQIAKSTGGDYSVISTGAMTVLGDIESNLFAAYPPSPGNCRWTTLLMFPLVLRTGSTVNEFFNAFGWFFDFT